MDLFSCASATRILEMKKTAMPFILRFVRPVDWDPGMVVHGHNVSVSAGDEKKWTHYDDSTGLLRTESDSVTD